MISRLGLRNTTTRLLVNNRRIGLNSAYLVTRRTLASKPEQKATIIDHLTDEVIELTDPDRPQMGNYPNPKSQILAQDKDPYAKYDDPQNLRNKNDPMNFDEDMYDIWSPDSWSYVSDKTALKHNAYFFGSLIAFFSLLAYFEMNPEKPAMIRSYPYNGLATHMGAKDETDAHLFQARVDHTAEEECGILPVDDVVISQKEEYLKANAAFINV
ncbi:uncharacterized protein J8A68_003611 [[Candida] subhashii]|uniref:Uncharacterized protein n=1 Tax=[Candida] subhashii TaxID=561895 RepID=A0A8J5QDB9_9ASCO|nr:uncharacterized protein J8A68_003611 [[Candida] subhashii]KAG7662841.1 hypothetical protein J8A68_003611 [[Candida] subhashii]